MHRRQRTVVSAVASTINCHFSALYPISFEGVFVSERLSRSGEQSVSESKKKLYKEKKLFYTVRNVYRELYDEKTDFRFTRINGSVGLYFGSAGKRH